MLCKFSAVSLKSAPSCDLAGRSAGRVFSPTGVLVATAVSGLCGFVSSSVPQSVHLRGATGGGGCRLKGFVGEQPVRDFALMFGSHV